MTEKIKVIRIWCISVTLPFVLLTLSNCSTLLKATFEKDNLGTFPDRTLPGRPTGDELAFIPVVEVQLQVAATINGTSGSRRSLVYSDVPLSVPTSGHATWVTFTGRSSNFKRIVSFTWSGRRDVQARDLFIDITDGSLVIVARLEITANGTLLVNSDYGGSAGTAIGTIPANERHEISVSIDRASGVYGVSVIKASGNINQTNIPLPASTPGNTARPSLLFNYDGYFNSSRYIIDEVIITRKK